MQLDTYN